MKPPVKNVYSLREGAYYSLPSLADYLAVSYDDVKAFVDYMRNQEVCKTDSGTDECSFQFVGIVEFETRERESGGETDRRMVFIEPKFVKHEVSDTQLISDGFSTEQKIVLKAILKYCKGQNASMFSSGRLTAVGGCSTRLSRRLALILDVMENGVYQVPKDEHRINGVGAIAWEETFARIEPVFLQDGPAYVECITRETDYDDEGYISRLQACLATRCLGYFEEIGLAEPLGLFVGNTYDGEIADFGEMGCIEARVRSELNSQFIDVKQQSLRLMLSVLELDDSNLGSDLLDFQSFGMSGFHALWETAIKEVLRDELEKTPASLGFRAESLEIDVRKKLNLPLKKFIDPPIWIKAETQTKAIPVADESDPLEPDFVATHVKINDVENLVIIDAKYYLPEFDGGRVRRQPGVGDVDKQLLYQLAYSPLSKVVRNAFVFPGYWGGKNCNQRDKLQSSHFATVKVPVFSLGKDLPDSFESYMVDGLSLLDRYVNCISDDEQHTLLKDVICVKSENGNDDGWTSNAQRCNQESSSRDN